MKRIIVSVSNDLTTDQRVDKVCTSLLQLDYDVLLVGRQLKNSKPLFRPYKTKRLKLLFNTGFLFFAEYNIRLFFYLLFSKKEILLANDLDTLTANFLISKIQRKKLVYDSHELFTEVPELIHRKRVQKVWLKIEAFIFPKLKNVFTVNAAIANIYATTYQVPVQYIKNYPRFQPIEKGKLPFDAEGKKIILYQGAVNVGRGLELLIETVALLDHFILLIVGEGDIIQKLKAKVKEQSLREKVIFLGKITPQELRKITPLATLGCSVEEDMGLNYHYALPNKIFDYIQAEIPVIVSNLPEMKQVVLDHSIGEILIDRTPLNFAQLIQKVANSNYINALQKAKKELTWESEEQKLFEIFKNLN